MQKIFYLFIISLFLVACPSEKIDPPVYSNDYGKGLYIMTEDGVNFYDYKNNELKENIFSTVNGLSLTNPSSLRNYGERMYIVTEGVFHVVDVDNFLSEFSIDGFDNAQDCEYAKFNRVYVSDKGSSEIKVVDLNTREVSAHIKTGDNVNPSDIVLSWERAFVVNSGGDDPLEYDSTICAINVKDGVIPINEFSGNILVDKNPVSILHNGSIIVLCKGVYDENNPAVNEESSIVLVGAGSLNLQTSNTLSGLYDADNLLINKSETKYYITTSGGVYYISTSSFANTLVTDKKVPTSMIINRESFANTDTTTLVVDFLYMNDKGNKDYIYKYNVYLNQFVDSFQLTSEVIDLEIHE